MKFKENIISKFEISVVVMLLLFLLKTFKLFTLFLTRSFNMLSFFFFLLQVSHSCGYFFLVTNKIEAHQLSLHSTNNNCNK